MDGGKRILDLSVPAVMGILNITPDSFYDGGKIRSDEDVLKRVEQMLAEGAAIIDVGAVSTRPGADEVSQAEERQRLLPVIQRIKKHFPESILSIDTYRSEIAREAIQAGGHIINDISSGNMDPEMPATIAELKVPYIMMHMQGTPATMQIDPQYSDVVEEIFTFFRGKVNMLKQLGVYQNIIIDPGFGFGKTVEHNFLLLKHLERFCSLGFPVMAGISRKSMVNRVLKTKPDNALNGTTALHVIALMNGASILRVHDVKEAAEAIKLVAFYKSA